MSIYGYGVAQTAQAYAAGQGCAESLKEEEDNIISESDQSSNYNVFYREGASCPAGSAVRAHLVPSVGHFGSFVTSNYGVLAENQGYPYNPAAGQFGMHDYVWDFCRGALDGQQGGGGGGGGP